MDHLKIMFFGTSEFAVPILEALVKTIKPDITVVTAQDKPVGRKQVLTPSPVKEFARKHGIPTLQPKDVKDPQALEAIKGKNPDLIIVAAYGKILPKEIVELPPYGSLNIHPSLLPKYRGPSPIQTAILNEEKKTGITIILMDEKIDHGPVLNQEAWMIKKNSTFKDLSAELAKIGAELLLKTLPSWINGEIKTRKQKEAEAVYTKILRKEDGKIDWGESASRIESRIRAFEPWPSAYTRFKNIDNRFNVLKVLKGFVLKQTDIGPFGASGKTFLAPDDQIAVQTGKDFLVIERLQLEGKKPMNTEDFIRGHRNFVGVILE